MIETWDDMYSPTVSAGASIEKFQANYVPASQVIDTLAEQSNYWWKIDKNAILYFLPKTYQEVNYTLGRSDIIGKPQVKQGNPLYRNVQYIKGGRNTTNEKIETFKGDGDTQSFTVGYNINEEPTIEVDRGSGFVEESVGLKGRSEGQDWYWERNSNTIIQDDDGTVLSDTDRIRVTYIGIYPSITIQRDDDAITTQQARENTTTGRVEDAVNEDIEGRQNTLDYASRLLTKYAEDSTTLSWKTRYSDHEAGDLITVDLPELNLEEKLLVTNVTITDDNAQLFYDVEAVRGPKHKTWSQFFNDLKARAEKELRVGISAEDVLVIPYEYDKTWVDADKPNIFRQIYPSDAGDTWEQGFDTTQTWGDYSTEEWSLNRGFDLFPASDLYPNFLAEDRVNYIAFYRAGSEEYRKAITKQSPPAESPIKSETYIAPEEYTGTIDTIRWFGGFKAGAGSGTGIEIGNINFNDSKTELEAYQIERSDINGL